VRRDPEDTKRRIISAATDEFCAHGLAGTRMERVAAKAGVNKERVYGHFGSKEALFQRVLEREMTLIAEAVPISINSPEDVASLAGKAYDYHRAHPQLVRLLHWEALETDLADVPGEGQRRSAYQAKVAAFAEAQRRGEITSDIAPDLLAFIILAIAAWWTDVPQVARLMEAQAATPCDHDRRRAAVAEAARRLADPAQPAQ
jgi:AcrR family transcriptional regulator